MPGGSYIVPSATTVAGTALSAYVERLADKLGTYVEYMTSAVATLGEARRLALVNELRDDEEQRSVWGGGYCYAMTGAQAQVQRRVLKEGYEGPVGALVLSRPWDVALASGVRVALSKPLPVREYLGVKGLVDLVNEALQRLEVVARIVFTGDGTRSYDLSGYPFIASKADTIGIRDRYSLTASEPTDWSPYPYEINTNGSTVTLETGYAYPASQTFELVVPVPADRLIYDGASWSYGTTGLVDDTNQAAAKIEHVVAFGMVMGLSELIKMTRADPSLPDTMKAQMIDGSGGLVDRKRPWVKAAARVVRYEMPKRRAAPSQGIISMSSALMPTGTL